MALAWEDLCGVARKPELIKKHSSDRLWRMFGPLVLARTHDHSFVIAQLGQSLDGRIATPTGHSHYINGADALEHLHRLRALTDAVIVGASTAALDNPSLTVRRVAGANPARVIIDPNRRVDITSQVFVDDGVRTVIVGPSRKHDPAHIECLPANNENAYPPRWIVEQLVERGLKRLLVEGGATTVSRFMTEKALDRLHILTGPLIIGSGPVGINLDAIDHLDHALRPAVTIFPFDSGDVVFDCNFSNDARGST